MNLLIVRHAVAMDRKEFQLEARRRAKSEGLDPDTETQDELRPLTDDGIRRMRQELKRLGKLVRKPDLLVTSPLRRAVQTTEVLLELWDGLEFDSCSALKPGAPFNELVEWIHAQPQYSSESFITVVGHEPHLSAMISWFCSGSSRPFVEIKKGGAALLEFATEFDKGRGKLLWLSTPKMLR